ELAGETVGRLEADPMTDAAVEAEDGAILDEQRVAILKIDADEVRAQTINGKVAKPHVDVGCVDRNHFADCITHESTERSRAVDRDRLGDVQGKVYRKHAGIDAVDLAPRERLVVRS